MADDQDVLLLFQKPNEPLFTKKDNGKAAFDVPEEYLTDRYKPIGNELSTRFGETVERKIPLRRITPPDLSFATVIGKNAAFSLFNLANKQIAGQLIKLLMDLPDTSSFLSTAAYIKDRVNPYLFQYALAVATAHRPDTKNLSLPSIVQMFPNQFIDSSVFPRAREEAALVSQSNRMLIDIPRTFTATDREIEQSLAYFREDIGVNMHHWHWHLVYPGEGEDVIVNKDRRGELFYYMHNQIIARYNVERLANGLAKVRPFTNFREPIVEAYFPKIIRSSNNRAYPPRVSNTVLSDINRPVDNTFVEVGDIERWRDRIYEAIDRQAVLHSNGSTIPLTAENGIDILGNIVESCALTPNRQLYGNLHNQGHNVISYSHDPEGRYLEDYGVMGDVATAMRDPIFYRWHAFIDQLFGRFKNLLPAYNPTRDFEFGGVSVDQVSVKISSGNAPSNALLTYWQLSDVDLSAGLDFGPEGNVYAQFTHLQHAPFDYNITVTNNSRAARRGTCRIFIGPTVDEKNNPISFQNQRTLMVEMDTFTVTLNPGQNIIRQRSEDSSVTIPYERSFRRIGSQSQRDAADLAAFQFCGCGWPQHMLLPKGTAQGTQYAIFVMVTNFEDDNVNQDPNKNFPCNDAASFCGLKDQLYPDRRAMGFPFDRPYTDADTLDDFAKTATNMLTTTCTIRFVDKYINRS